MSLAQRNQVNSNDLIKVVIDDLTDKSHDLQKEGNYEQVLTIIRAQKELSDFLSIQEIQPKRNKPGRPRKSNNQSKSTKNKNQSAQTNSLRTRQTTNDSDYEVDTSTPYGLDENFKFKRPHAFELKGHYMETSTWKEVLIETCKALYYLDPNKFSKFAEGDTMKWGGSFNFSKDKDVIREPAIIGDSGIYVESAKDSMGTRQLILKMLDNYNIDPNEYKIYLRADYSPKRENDENYRKRQK